MKLTKEQVYINLQGKTKEELADLWNFLNKSGGNQFRETISDFLYNYNGWIAYEFSDDVWQFSSSQSLNGKTEVTIEQLKEIIKPMENKEPKSNELKALLEIYYSCRNKHTLINKDDIFKKYDCINSEYMSVCLKEYNLINLKGRRSKWISSKPDEYMADNFLIFVKDYIKTKNKKQYLERKGNIIETSITEQLQKAEAEVKRLQSLIEEENKPKIGDWCRFYDDKKTKFSISKLNKIDGDIRFSYETSTGAYYNYAEKITNKELIKLLENE